MTLEGVRALGSRAWPPRTWATLALTLSMLGGCAHMGPGTVPVDRFNYAAAIGASWKEQTLLNVVKLRYADLPVFVDIASIVSGYSMESTVSLLGGLSSANSLSLGAEGRFTDRPTITYVPVTGEKFLRGLLTPLDPKDVFFMLQAGYPADFLLGLTVESINGVNNRSASAVDLRQADPDFNRALSLMRDLQQAGGVALRVEAKPDAKVPAATVYLRREGLSPELAAKSAEIRRIFKLPPGVEMFALDYSPAKEGENELAVKTRSIFQIMTALSTYIEVPEADLAGRSANPLADAAPSGQARIRIRSGKARPEHAFVAVQYRDHWFWIDDDDWATKRALSAVVLLFSLADTATDENAAGHHPRAVRRARADFAAFARVHRQASEASARP